MAPSTQAPRDEELALSEGEIDNAVDLAFAEDPSSPPPAQPAQHTAQTVESAIRVAESQPPFDVAGDNEVEGALDSLFKSVDSVDAELGEPLIDVAITADTILEGRLPPEVAQLLENENEKAGIRFDGGALDAYLETAFFEQDRQSEEPEYASGEHEAIPELASVLALGRGESGEHSTYISIKKLGHTGDRELHLVSRLLPDKSARACVLVRYRPEAGINAQLTRARFMAEAKILSAMNHPNVVGALDVGVHDSVPFYVRPFISGANLGKIAEISKSPLSPAVIAEIGRQTARGLSYIHNKTDRAGVALDLVHGHLSPYDIVVSLDGSVKLTEIGVSRLGNQTLRAATGGRKGHPNYAAPEQRQGWPVDARSDIFSLGLILAEMITNRPLLGGTVRLEQLEEEIRLRCGSRRDVPPEFIELLVAMTKRIPTGRLASADELHEKLSKMIETLGGPVDLKEVLAPAFSALKPVVPFTLPPSTTQKPKTATLDLQKKSTMATYIVLAILMSALVTFVILMFLRR